MSGRDQKSRRVKSPGGGKCPVGSNPRKGQIRGTGECLVGSNPRVGSNVRGVKKVRESARWCDLTSEDVSISSEVCK